MNKILFKGIKECLYYEKLKNGLEIYMVPNDKVKNYYLTLNVRYGSIHTDFKYNKTRYKVPRGIAHYLEHLMFNMPDKNVFDYYSKLGSSINAYTSYDITCYEVYANSKFKENLAYLLEYVNTPYFTKEMINNERDIIIEEIKMYQDNPSTELLYGTYRNLFVKDERQYLISGTVEDVKKIKLEDIEISYQVFYHPKNMFLILTGNFNPEEAVAIVEESLSKLDIPEYIKPEIIEQKEPLKVNQKYNVKKMNVDKPKVSFGIKIPKANFKSLNLSKLELKLYINLLMRINFGSTSLFKEELISNQIINDNLSLSLIDTTNYYVQAIMASTDYPEYFIKKIKEKIANIVIDNEEIRRKVKSSISNLIMLFDDIEVVNSDIQNDLLIFNEVISDIYDKFNELNLETAKKVAEKLQKNMISVTILEPKDEEKKV